MTENSWYLEKVFRESLSEEKMDKVWPKNLEDDQCGGITADIEGTEGS